MDDCGIFGIVRTEDTLSGVLKGSEKIQGRLQARGVLVGKVGFPKCTGAEEYDGAYDVIPKTYAQELGTDNKVMRDNVRVEKIPYFETSNEKGTTVYIANEV